MSTSTLGSKAKLTPLEGGPESAVPSANEPESKVLVPALPDLTTEQDRVLLQLYSEPFHAAAITGDLNAIKSMLAEFWSAKLFDLQRRLIEHRNPNNYAMTALMEATFSGYIHTVDLLVRFCQANVHAKDGKLGSKAVHLAARNGHFEILRYFLNLKCKLLEAKNKRGDTPLWFAATKGHQELVEYLVTRKKAHVDPRGHLGRTPLLAAAAKGHHNVVQFLLEHGRADIYARSNSDQDQDSLAIHLAAENGHLSIVSYLLALRPEFLAARDKYGNTPLWRAAFSGQLGVVKFLTKEKHANVDTVGRKRRTALHVAVHNGHLPTARYLLSKRHFPPPRIDARDSELGSMPIHLAVDRGHFAIVRFLLELYPQLVDVTDKNNSTSLWRAAAKGHLEIVEHLVLERKAKVDVRGLLGRTPLQIAAFNGHLAVVRFLLEKGRADLTARDFNPLFNDTALHLASRKGHSKVVAFLLDFEGRMKSKLTGHGLPPLVSVRNKAGQTPLNIAKQEVKTEVVGILERNTIHSIDFT